jgi:hypothetical protein
MRRALSREVASGPQQDEDVGAQQLASLAFAAMPP